MVKDLLHKYKPHIEGLISDLKGAAGEVASEAKKSAVSELNNPQNLLKAANYANQASAELNKLD